MDRSRGSGQPRLLGLGGLGAAGGRPLHSQAAKPNLLAPSPGIAASYRRPGSLIGGSSSTRLGSGGGGLGALPLRSVGHHSLDTNLGASLSDAVAEAAAAGASVNYRTSNDGRSASGSVQAAGGSESKVSVAYSDDGDAGACPLNRAPTGAAPLVGLAEGQRLGSLDSGRPTAPLPRLRESASGEAAGLLGCAGIASGTAVVSVGGRGAAAGLPLRSHPGYPGEGSMTVGGPAAATAAAAGTPSYGKPPTAPIQWLPPVPPKPSAAAAATAANVDAVAKPGAAASKPRAKRPGKQVQWQLPERELEREREQRDRERQQQQGGSDVHAVPNERGVHQHQPPPLKRQRLLEPGSVRAAAAAMHGGDGGARRLGGLRQPVLRSSPQPPLQALSYNVSAAVAHGSVGQRSRHHRSLVSPGGMRHLELGLPGGPLSPAALLPLLLGQGGLEPRAGRLLAPQTVLGRLKVPELPTLTAAHWTRLQRCLEGRGGAAADAAAAEGLREALNCLTVYSFMAAAQPQPPPAGPAVPPPRLDLQPAAEQLRQTQGGQLPPPPQATVAATALRHGRFETGPELEPLQPSSEAIAPAAAAAVGAGAIDGVVGVQPPPCTACTAEGPYDDLQTALRANPGVVPALWHLVGSALDRGGGDGNGETGEREPADVDAVTGGPSTPTPARPQELYRPSVAAAAATAAASGGGGGRDGDVAMPYIGPLTSATRPPPGGGGSAGSSGALGSPGPPADCAAAAAAVRGLAWGIGAAGVLRNLATADLIPEQLLSGVGLEVCAAAFEGLLSGPAAAEASAAAGTHHDLAVSLLELLTALSYRLRLPAPLGSAADERDERGSGYGSGSGAGAVRVGGSGGMEGAAAADAAAEAPGRDAVAAAVAGTVPADAPLLSPSPMVQGPRGSAAEESDERLEVASAAATAAGRPCEETQQLHEQQQGQATLQLRPGGEPPPPSAGAAHESGCGFGAEGAEAARGEGPWLAARRPLGRGHGCQRQQQQQQEATAVLPNAVAPPRSLPSVRPRSLLRGVTALLAAEGGTSEAEAEAEGEVSLRLRTLAAGLLAGWLAVPANQPAVVHALSSAPLRQQRQTLQQRVTDATAPDGGSPTERPLRPLDGLEMLLAPDAITAAWREAATQGRVRGCADVGAAQAAGDGGQEEEEEEGGARLRRLLAEWRRSDAVAAAVEMSYALAYGCGPVGRRLLASRRGLMRRLEELAASRRSEAGAAAAPTLHDDALAARCRATLAAAADVAAEVVAALAAGEDRGVLVLPAATAARLDGAGDGTCRIYMEVDPRREKGTAIMEVDAAARYFR